MQEEPSLTCTSCAASSESTGGVAAPRGRNATSMEALSKPVVDGAPAYRLRVVTYSEAQHGFDN
jgi:hypothetical protein